MPLKIIDVKHQNKPYKVYVDGDAMRIARQCVKTNPTTGAETHYERDIATTTSNAYHAIVVKVRRKLG